jgi:Putative transposase
VLTKSPHVLTRSPHVLTRSVRAVTKRMWVLPTPSALQTWLPTGSPPEIWGIPAHLRALETLARHSKSDEHKHWIPARSRFLFPVKAMSKVFRGKVLDGLDDLYKGGLLTLEGRCAELAERATFAKLKDRLYRKKWVVYAKQPFGGPEQVFQYLGRYTHRVGMSNQRLVSFDDHDVCFRTKHGKTTTINAVEFIRRFLLHVLPAGFVKIRHYGLLAAANVNTKLETARLSSLRRPIHGKAFS